jgi:hypothetical protein
MINVSTIGKETVASAMMTKQQYYAWKRMGLKTCEVCGLPLAPCPKGPGADEHGYVGYYPCRHTTSLDPMDMFGAVLVGSSHSIRAISAPDLDGNRNVAVVRTAGGGKIKKNDLIELAKLVPGAPGCGVAILFCDGKTCFTSLLPTKKNKLVYVGDRAPSTLMRAILTAWKHSSEVPK